LDWGYLGGFIDAEGSFVNRSGKHQKAVLIYNTNFEVLKEIKGFLGSGCILHPKKPRGHFGDKPIYVYQWTKADSNIAPYLQKLAPHIIVKQTWLQKFCGINTEPKVSWSYIAGFFDGDGCLEFAPSLRSGSWRFCIMNNYLLVLRKICDFLGFGSITAHGCSCYNLRLGKKNNVIKVGEKLLDLCIVQRLRIRDMLRFYATHEWHPEHKMKNVTRDELQELYLNKQLSIRQSARIYGVKYNPMREKLIKFGIPLRSNDEASRMRAQKMLELGSNYWVNKVEV